MSNTESDDAHGVVVTDAVPTNGTYVSGGSHASGVVTLTVGTVPGFGQNSASWVVSTCQTSLTNQWYRVVTSTEGVSSTLGAPLVRDLNAPSISASFDGGPTPIGIGGTVHFTDTSTTNGSPIKAWGWTFGDDQLGDGEQVAQAYAAGGTYTVTLIITDTAISLRASPCPMRSWF